MSQARKAAQLNTEYTGFEDGEVIKPKCFELLQNSDPSHLETATIGIAQLWSLYSTKRSDAVVQTDLHRITKGQNEPLLSLLMDNWLTQNRSILERHLKPVFRRQPKKSTHFNGTTDFIKAIIKNNGLLGPVESTRNILDLDYPHLRVIKDAYQILSDLYHTRRLSLIDKGVNRTLHSSMALLASVPSSPDPQKNALLVQSLRRQRANGDIHFDGLPRKLSRLSSVIDFSSDLVLSKEQSVEGSSIGVPGIKLNLNYLIQFALEEALVLNGGIKPESLFPEMKINNVKYLNPAMDLEYRRWMSPDIYGFIPRAENTGTAYILDSKHKAFFKHGGDIPSVGRDDFYQLLSYSATHYKQNSNINIDWFYGLIGLARETSILDVGNEDSFRYIDLKATGVFEIDYDSMGVPVQKKILAMPMRFSRLLFDCGESNNIEEIRLILKKLGNEILKTHEAHG